MKQKYLFTFPAAVSSQPITYLLIKEFDIKINILRAEYSLGREGHLLMELDAEEGSIEKALMFLGAKGIEYQGIEKRLSFNEKACIDCGSCTAVCFSNALSIKAPEWRLIFKPDLCIACGLCVKACPLQLITLTF